MNFGIKFKNETLELLSLQGELAISEPYEFQLLVKRRAEPHDLAEDLGQPVHFWIDDGDLRQYFYGYIYEAIRQNSGLYRFTLKPWLARLGMGRDRRCFLHQSLPEIVEAIFLENDMDHYSWVMYESATWRGAYTVQFDETPLAFISRLLAEQGFYYYFTFDKSGSHLWISNLPKGRLEHDIPSLEIASAPPYFQNQAHDLKHQHHPQGSWLHLSVTNIDLLPANLFQMTEEYRIEKTQVFAEINSEGFYFSAQLQAKPSSCSPSPCAAPKKRYHHPVTATVLARKPEAVLKLAFHWEHHPHDPALRPWIKLQALQRGEQEGSQWIPELGQEVLVTYLEGDPERPLVLGSLRNSAHLPNYSSPTTYARSGLKTAHEFYLDDHPQDPHIALYSAGEFCYTLQGDQALHIGGDFQEVIQNGQLSESLSQAYFLEAQEKIEFIAGDSFIRLEPHQITLSATSIQVNPPKSMLPSLSTRGQASKAAPKIQKILVIKIKDSLEVLEPWISQLAVSIAAETLYYQASQTGEFWLVDFEETTESFILNLQDPSRPEAVSIVALWDHPLAKVDHCLTLQASDWQHQAPQLREGQYFYRVEITVLQPAIVFNFRQDACLDLNDAELANYARVQEYFTDHSPARPHLPEADELSIEELRYFQKNSAQALIFIHGYNIAPGEYGRAYVETSDQLTPSSLFYTLHRPIENISQNLVNLKAFNPSGVYEWLIMMEYHLNKAAGFDERDYSKYTRIIGIIWQANPNSIDYTAAPLLADFPARKLLGLIQQLQNYGVEHIQIMTHSLGAVVLMRALEVCAAHAWSIEQAILWQAAIPNTSLEAQAPEVFPYPHYPLRYIYPHARQAATSWLVLYSHHDNILGQLPKTAETAKAPDFVNQALQDFFGASLGQSVIRLIENIMHLLFHTSLPASKNRPAILRDKYEDLGGGLLYAAIAEAIFLLDHFELPKISEHRKLLSIYHVANLIGYPLDYFTKDSLARSQQVYQEWIARYAHFTTPRGQYRFPETFDLAQEILKRDLDFSHYRLQCLLEIWLCMAHPSLANLPAAAALSSLFLLMLLTEEAKIAPALGYQGPQKPEPNVRILNQAALLPDHVGMLIPSATFMQKIYTEQLMINITTSLKVFGRYPLVKKDIPLELT